MDRNIKAFLSIARSDSLTAAAQQINLTQPSLTKRLHNLEEEIGASLFERHRRGMTLTAAGKLFYKRAALVEQTYSQAQEEIRSLNSAGLDVLRIGAGPLFNMHFVPTVFTKIHDEYPDLQLVMRADVNEQSLHMLIEEELDLVLGVVDDVPVPDGLSVIPMSNIEYGIISKNEDNSTSNSKISKKSLLSLSWILYGEHKSSEDWLQQYYQANGLGIPKVSIRTSAFSSGLQLVNSGPFAMIAPMLLAPVVEKFGLKIQSANPHIAVRSCGAHVRTSALGFGVVRRFLELLEIEMKGSVG